jgi:hypothetical protein
MADQALGTTTITQVGIIAQDIKARAQAWADMLGLPMPETQVTGSVNVAQTEYAWASSTACAERAFFHLGQVDQELIEPIGEPSTWKDQLDRHDDSLHHIAFQINGMQEKIA